VTLQLLTDSGSKISGRRCPFDAGIFFLGHRVNVSTIYEELDFMGASLDAGADQDYAALSLRVLKKDFDKGLGLFLDALTQPIFPEEEIKREIEKTLAAIQASEDQPEAVAEKEFQKALFLQSPYGHPVEGTRESLGGMTREAITQFYRTYYHPNNSILVV
jgi:zinc protease